MSKLADILLDVVAHIPFADEALRRKVIADIEEYLSDTPKSADKPDAKA